MYAFENAVRSMKPDIIATDEIGTNEDIDSILTEPINIDYDGENN